MSEDRVLQALRALAENDREREAPMAVEARLLREFRRHSARRGWRWLGDRSRCGGRGAGHVPVNPARIETGSEPGASGDPSSAARGAGRSAGGACPSQSCSPRGAGGEPGDA